MPITKQRKEELVATLTALLQQADGFVIIESQGLPVNAIQELRAKVRAANGKYMVAKNTLVTKALQQQGWPVPEKLLKGPVGIAFGLGNFPSVAKVVLEYVSDKDRAEKMAVKGGVMTGTVLDARSVEMVSNLPTLPELRAQLAGLIVQPAAGLVTVLNAATGQLVNVLHAYVKERGGDAA